MTFQAKSFNQQIFPPLVSNVIISYNDHCDAEPFSFESTLISELKNVTDSFTVENSQFSYTNKIWSDFNKNIISFDQNEKIRNSNTGVLVKPIFGSSNAIQYENDNGSIFTWNRTEKPIFGFFMKTNHFDPENTKISNDFYLFNENETDQLTGVGIEAYYDNFLLKEFYHNPYFSFENWIPIIMDFEYLEHPTQENYVNTLEMIGDFIFRIKNDIGNDWELYLNDFFLAESIPHIYNDVTLISYSDLPVCENSQTTIESNDSTTNESKTSSTAIQSSPPNFYFILGALLILLHKRSTLYRKK